jgi:isopentenyldiphosphate isomerase
VSALWLTDIGSGKVLLAQRKWNKKNDPGKWSAAAAGTIEEGEDYESNIVKETKEELGITGIKFKKGPEHYVDEGKNKYFVHWYFAKINKNEVSITIQEDEVEAVRWVDVKDLIADVRLSPDKYTPNFIGSLELLGYDLNLVGIFQ